VFPNFFGNAQAAGRLWNIARSGRIPQTLLLAGPEGVGKATLARRFAAELLGDAGKIECDDLSLEPNQALIADREKWTAEKRNEDPLVLSSHPDFLTFAPDGPLRQISIPQMRLLREKAQFQPLRGTRRVFLIDRIDRANEQAANSLLKTLEEPPPHLVILMTAENAYDLLPTIRSRTVLLQLGRLASDEMEAFVRARGLDEPNRRIWLANGSPGAAATLDLELYTARRAAMLALLETGAGAASFASWAKVAESLSTRKQDRIEDLMNVLLLLLEDILLLQNNVPSIRNRDLEPPLAALARRVSFPWLRTAAAQAAELCALARRNIQKPLALDAFLISLTRAS
jgi:DNA polymerase-3 subunit delta'